MDPININTLRLKGSLGRAHTRITFLPHASGKLWVANRTNEIAQMHPAVCCSPRVQPLSTSCFQITLREHKLWQSAVWAALKTRNGEFDYRNDAFASRKFHSHTAIEATIEFYGLSGRPNKRWKNRTHEYVAAVIKQQMLRWCMQVRDSRPGPQSKVPVGFLLSAWREWSKQ